MHKTVVFFSKTKYFFWYLALTAIPFGIRTIFNFEEVANCEGFREQQSFSFFLVDLAAVIFATFFVLKKISGFLFFNNKPSEKKEWHDLLPLLFLLLAFGTSFFFSPKNDLSVYALVRFVWIVIFFHFAKNLLSTHGKVLKLSLLIFVIGGFVQATIAGVQFFSQHSLGLSFLGESQIAPDILGVAKFDFGGQKFIRSYGTFPHPNLLAAYLLFSLSSGLVLLSSIFRCRTISQNENFFSSKKIFLPLVFVCLFIVLGIIMTYSRSAIAATFLILAVFAINNRKYLLESFLNLTSLGSRLVLPAILALALLSFFLILVPRLCLSDCPNDNSLALRGTYLEAARNMIAQSPLLGIGPGNFVSQLSKDKTFYGLRDWEIQPVHNIYFLIASEWGFVALAMLLVFLLFKMFRKKFFPVFSATEPLELTFVLFLLLGFIDHYFWTLVQGSYLFWLALAFFCSSARIKSS